jgi:hypothetical protein
MGPGSIWLLARGVLKGLGIGLLGLLSLALLLLGIVWVINLRDEPLSGRDRRPTEGPPEGLPLHPPPRPDRKEASFRRRAFP